MIELPENEVITAGDYVTQRQHHPTGYYKVKASQEQLLIKYRYAFGGGWATATYGPDEMGALHSRWRKVTESPAVTMLRHFWNFHRMDNSEHAEGIGLRQALELAIYGQLEFWEDDFSLLARNEHNNMRYPVDPEGLYTFCFDPYWQRSRQNKVNLSAVKALEKYMNRERYVLYGERIYVGRRFDWEGLQVLCTSIRRELVGGREVDCYVVACAQRHVRDPKTSNLEVKTDRIFRITHKDLAATGE